MYKFLESMKAYVKGKLNADEEISTQIDVYDVYTKGHTPQKTEIQFQIMDNSEVDRYTSFDGANIFSIPLQITVFAFRSKIADKVVSARELSVRLAEKVINILNAKDVVESNERVKRVRLMTTTPAMQFETGDKAYTTAIRYEFWVAKQ